MTAGWTIESMPELDGYTLEWAEPGRLLISRRELIYEAATLTSPRRLVGKVGVPLSRSLPARLRLGQRALRFMAYNVRPLAGGEIFVTFGKQVGVLRDGRWVGLGGMDEPFRVLRGGCATGADGFVYIGEYIDTLGRQPMSIFRYRPGTSELERIHTFPVAEIKHIHGVYSDPYQDQMWVTTGDLPNECKIMVSSDSFNSLQTVGEGDETWRAVSILLTAEAAYYATDAEQSQNRIYRLDRKTGERRAIADVGGPVYYGRKVGPYLLFAVTAELCPSQRVPEAEIWCVDPDDTARKIFSARKDLAFHRLLLVFFMPGTFHFPLGPGNDQETCVHAVGLAGLDNRTLCLRRPG